MTKIEIFILRFKFSFVKKLVTFIKLDDKPKLKYINWIVVLLTKLSYIYYLIFFFSFCIKSLHAGVYKVFPFKSLTKRK